jgi:hypothetical protein
LGATRRRYSVAAGKQIVAPTPIPARHILSFEERKQIVLHFLATGERSNAVSWESI